MLIADPSPALGSRRLPSARRVSVPLLSCSAFCLSHRSVRGLRGGRARLPGAGGSALRWTALNAAWCCRGVGCAVWRDWLPSPLFNLLYLTPHLPPLIILKDFLQNLPSSQAWTWVQTFSPQAWGILKLGSRVCNQAFSGCRRGQEGSRALCPPRCADLGAHPGSGLRESWSPCCTYACEERRWYFFDFLLSDSNNFWF